MYIKNYKNFLPEDYIKKSNINKSKNLLKGFILLSIINLLFLGVNLNLQEQIKEKEKNKTANYINSEESIKSKGFSILNLKSILEYDKIKNLLIKDNNITFKVDEGDLAEIIDKLNDLGEVSSLTYLMESNIIQVEGKVK